jgi:hypothetical protein
MALNINAIKSTAKPTTMPARKGSITARDLGPNFFLDKAWDKNLQASYDNAEAYEITVAGEFKDDTVKKGPKKGQPLKRLTGDAADAVTLLRAAADTLKIGVSVTTVPARAKGQVVVKYLGQKRKAARKPKVSVPPVAVPAVAPPVAAPVAADKATAAK